MGWRRILRSALIGTIVAALAVAALEGLASFALLARDLRSTRWPASQPRHTRHDAEIGWVNIPNVSIPNLYGPGVGLTINANGFRNKFDVAFDVPTGKTRVVCSGDSFTLGAGVADGQTWCDMVRLDGLSLENVNLGQGGYGIDQAYLLYEREGSRFKHQVHIFAFIPDDIRRMRSDRFGTKAKPVLRIKDGTLATEGVPVPNLTAQITWLQLNAHHFGALRMSQLLQSSHDDFDEDSNLLVSVAESVKTALKVFEEVDRRARATKVVTVFVLLPTPWSQSQNFFFMNEYLKLEMERRGLVFISLVDDFARETNRARLFIREGALPDPATANHLSVEGNALVARLLSKRLSCMPRLCEALSLKCAE